jgi:hypothetical protein
MGKKSKNNNTQHSGFNGQPKIGKKEYEAEIFKLQVELVKLQDWVKATNARMFDLYVIDFCFNAISPGTLSVLQAFRSRIINCQFAAAKLKQTGRNMPRRFLPQNRFDAVRFSGLNHVSP